MRESELVGRNVESVRLQDAENNQRNRLVFRTRNVNGGRQERNLVGIAHSRAGRKQG